MNDSKHIIRIKGTLKRSVIIASSVLALSSPLTAFAQSNDGAVVSEVDKNGKPFSVAGNGQVVDDISDDSTKQFITVETKDNKTFFMVIDRAQSQENVYMLSLVDENDLSEFVSDSSSSDVVAVDSDAKGSDLSKDKSDIENKDNEEKKGPNVMVYIIFGLIAAVAGAGYYFKVYKPKKDALDEKEEGIEGEVFEEEYDEEEIEETYDEDDDEEVEYVEVEEDEEEEEIEEEPIETDDIEEIEDDKGYPKKKRGHGRRNKGRAR